MKSCQALEAYLDGIEHAAGVRTEGNVPTWFRLLKVHLSKYSEMKSPSLSLISLALFSLAVGGSRLGRSVPITAVDPVDGHVVSHP